MRRDLIIVPNINNTQKPTHKGALLPYGIHWLPNTHLSSISPKAYQNKHMPPCIHNTHNTCHSIDTHTKPLHSPPKHQNKKL